MTRTALRPLVALGLPLAALIYVGCGRPAPEPGASPARVVAPAGPKADPAGKDAGAGSKLFADWKNPDAVVILSGQQDGYLEPCGCSEKQLGGMARRLDLVERTRAQGWPVALVDLGNLISDPAASRGGAEQVKVKYNVALRGLTTMKYDAVALAAGDLRLGVLETLGQLLNLDQQTQIVAANVKPEAGFEEIIRPSRRTTAGPVKLGITAVMAPSEWETLNDPQKDLLTVVEPQEVLPEVLEDLEGDTDVQILLVQGPPEMAESLAATYPGFDLVIGTSHFADPPDQPKSLNGGKTWLVQVGKKGKYVGVVGIWKDGTPRFRYQRQSLGDRFQNDNAISRLINEDYQAELKQLGVVENFPRRTNIKGAPGATYVGAAACQSCHPNTYSRWEGSKHAKGFESIKKDQYTHRGDRSFDAECVSCHTTGFEYVGGWVSEEKTPYLKGNQCENCHGPGSKHVEDPVNPTYLAAMELVAEEAGKSLCIQCHDEDNSPKFDFPTYWGKIAHFGLDKYDDPRVRQGKPAEIARQPEP